MAMLVISAKGVIEMAKFNKYWGFVALGAATAAAAGAATAILTKKNRTESVGYEDDFEDFDDFDIPEDSDTNEESDAAEAFVAWEDTADECEDSDIPNETTEEIFESDEEME